MLWLKNMCYKKTSQSDRQHMGWTFYPYKKEKQQQTVG